MTVFDSIKLLLMPMRIWLEWATSCRAPHCLLCPHICKVSKNCVEVQAALANIVGDSKQQLWWTDSCSGTMWCSDAGWKGFAAYCADIFSSKPKKESN